MLRHPARGHRRRSQLHADRAQRVSREVWKQPSGDFLGGGEFIVNSLCSMTNM